MIKLDRPHYKLMVDMALRSQDKPIVLPHGQHPMWGVIEMCWKANKSTVECVALVNRLYTILSEGTQ